ncbi:MAG TPA: 3,4-dihydroxy-2-butanone-4-phosphate synthase, partial [Allosphingosinicella sp.]|nr:3,4-dihydroxy-2-butanone-4-phosphate synthase [Allosphingosinicella sp.]
EDRENEGDLVIPAQMATPDAINFMAKHGRGLICLALTRERVESLALSPMSRTNGTQLGTAFTTSIEARDGVTTGISAADRARTISVAIDAAKGAEDIVSPGHVFPLIARDGGVLVRAGHTEAAVDVARLAGLNPSGVICEIMSDDGSMERMDGLFAFAQRHGLRIGTIRDLIAYRLRKDRIVEQTAEARFESRWGGTWTARTFLNKVSGVEQIALVKGHVDPGKPTLVRMHALSILSDAFAEEGARGGLLEGAMKAIAAEGAGVIVVINRPLPGAMTEALKVRAGARAPADNAELRDYGVGAQILAELGVHDMILLTNSHHTPVALGGYGLAIVGERPIAMED